MSIHAEIKTETKQSQTDRKANKHRWNRTTHTAPGPNGQKQRQRWPPHTTETRLNSLFEWWNQNTMGSGRT